MFQCKQFTIHQYQCAMKVTEMACLFGAWVASKVHSKSTILDIGSGTGLLSLMMGQKNQNAEILGIEIDELAVSQSIDNLKTAKFNHKINFMQQDIRTWQFHSTFDVITCNPPFFENQLSTQDFKKKTAWHSDSLTLEELLSRCNMQLQADGVLYLLLPCSRFSELEGKAKTCQLHMNHVVEIAHSEQHMPKTMICQLSKNYTELVKERFYIKEDGKYSNAFTKLLKDYYLRF